MDEKSGKQAIEYGIVPIDVMASMSGLDFVRAIFARRLPEPPIMQTVEPFDCKVEPGAVVIHSVPGLRHYKPIGSVQPFEGTSEDTGDLDGEKTQVFNVKAGELGKIFTMFVSNTDEDDDDHVH